MKMRAAMCMLVAASAWAASDHVWARAGEVTITGVVSHIDPATRIATVTPASGPPVVVQFSWNIGGPCDKCVGGGRSGPLFEKTVTEGSTWTITYTSSVPAGAAIWFPGGTIHTVYSAMKPEENFAAPPQDGERSRRGEEGAP